MKIFFNVVMIGILLKIAWEDFRSAGSANRLLILLLAAGLWNRFGYGEMQGILWESVAGILSVSGGDAPDLSVETRLFWRRGYQTDGSIRFSAWLGEESGCLFCRHVVCGNFLRLDAGGRED